MIMWLRRIAAVPLVLVTFVCGLGAIKALEKNLHDAGVLLPMSCS